MSAVSFKPSSLYNFGSVLTPSARNEKAKMHGRATLMRKMRARKHHLRILAAEADGKTEEASKNRATRARRGGAESQ